MPKKHPGGRPPEYNSKMVERAEQYLTACKDRYGNKYKSLLSVNLPSLEGLAIYLGISRSTVYEWQKSHQEFSDITERILATQAIRLMNSGLAGTYNPTISKLILAKHGYRESSEVDHTSKGEKIEGFNYIVPTDAPNSSAQP